MGKRTVYIPLQSPIFYLVLRFPWIIDFGDALNHISLTLNICPCTWHVLHKTASHLTNHACISHLHLRILCTAKYFSFFPPFYSFSFSGYLPLSTLSFAPSTFPASLCLSFPALSESLSFSPLLLLLSLTPLPFSRFLSLFYFTLSFLIFSSLTHFRQYWAIQCTFSTSCANNALIESSMRSRKHCTACSSVRSMRNFSLT